MGSLRDTFGAVHLEKQQIAVCQTPSPDVLECACLWTVTQKPDGKE